MNAFINKEVSEKSSKKYLIFRPYIDPMNLKPYQPPDKGYYFKFNNTNVKIVRYTYEDNGFRETKGHDWTFCWSSGNLKQNFFP